MLRKIITIVLKIDVICSVVDYVTYFAVTVAMIYIVVVVACLFRCTSPTSPDEWINMKCPCVSPRLATDGHRWYYFQTWRKLTWYAAHDYCVYNGMRLLTIGTDAEELDVAQHIRNSHFIDDSYWTSATRFAAIDTFVWMTTGQVIYDDLLWSPGRPSASINNNCTILEYNSNWKLYDVSCDKLHYVICESLPCFDIE